MNQSRIALEEPRQGGHMADGQQLDEILASYFRAHADGRNPDRSVLLACHPAQAAALREFFRDYDDFNHRLDRLEKDTTGQDRSALWAEYERVRRFVAEGPNQST